MKAKSTKWQWIVIIVLGIALLATIGLSMSAAWFHDSDGADTDTELGHAVTVRLQDVESGEDGVKGWKELYNSSKTQAYPGDTLVAATRIELKSTTPTLIRAKITATVKDADGNAVTLSADKPTDMGEMTDDEYYTALIASKKTDEDYETKSIAWNIYLLGNMMKSLELDTSEWTQVGDWMYYTSIYGDTTSPSQSTSGTIDLFDKLVLNPLLTNEAANWKISLNLTVEAIQAANMESSTHPWYDDIQDINFGEYDRANYGGVEPSSATYFSFDTSTGTITGLQGDGLNATDIVIPSKINSVAVTAIGDNAFKNNTTLETVAFATSSLSASSQSGSQTAARMKTRASSSGVQTIGSSAFRGCYNLTSINLPKTLTSIGNYAFRDCRIKSINLPNGLISIGDWAFYANNITSITIPSSVASIGDWAFGSCSSVKYLTFAEGSQLTSINDYTFAGCFMTSLTIPEGVTSIGEGAFHSCDKLTSITIPSSVESIGDEVFKFCRRLTQINFNATNCDDGTYSSDMFHNAGTEGDGIDVIFGSGVNKIPANLFSFCSTLKSVTIGENVTTIGAYAFYNRDGLTSITIPSSVTSIEKKAFFDCSGLVNIYYCGSEAEKTEKIKIGENAFGNCNGTWCYYNATSTATSGNFWHYNENGVPTVWNTEGIFITNGNGEITGLTAYGKTLSSIEIPSELEGVIITSIGNNAFNGCGSLTSITIPEGVTSIGYRAFESCGSLTSIAIPSRVESIGYNAFSGCTGLTSITIPEGVTSIGDCAFEGCSGLESITVDSDNTTYKSEGNCLLTKDGKALILGCKNSVIPSSVTSIKNYAFSGCNGLESITVDSENTTYKSEGNCLLTKDGKTLILGCKNSVIPSSVTSIGGCAFYGCSGLTSITIPSSVTEIYSSAFSGCSSLTSVTIPSSVELIDYSTFSGCTGLTSITIPEGVTEIYDEAFLGCSSLKEITIPDSVEMIAANAFYGCISLTSIIISGSVYLSCAAFYDCISLTSIAISGGLTGIEDVVFEGCDVLEYVFYGTGEQWEECDDWVKEELCNQLPSFACIYYYSKTERTGGYWHYVDGVPTVW